MPPLIFAWALGSEHLILLKLKILIKNFVAKMLQVFGELVLLVFIIMVKYLDIVIQQQMMVLFFLLCIPKIVLINVN